MAYTCTRDHSAPAASNPTSHCSRSYVCWLHMYITWARAHLLWINSADLCFFFKPFFFFAILQDPRSTDCCPTSIQKNTALKHASRHYLAWCCLMHSRSSGKICPLMYVQHTCTPRHQLQPTAHTARGSQKSISVERSPRIQNDIQKKKKKKHFPQTRPCTTAAVVCMYVFAYTLTGLLSLATDYERPFNLPAFQRTNMYEVNQRGRKEEKKREVTRHRDGDAHTGSINRYRSLRIYLQGPNHAPSYSLFDSLVERRISCCFLMYITFCINLRMSERYLTCDL